MSIPKDPQIIKPYRVIGEHLIFQDVDIGDAQFILDLRSNPLKNAHISAIPYDLDIQIDWIRRYKHDLSQVYFLILNKNLEKIGTVRLYNIEGLSFTWGSWILKENSPSNYSIESALMVYQYALQLGFHDANFSVRTSNTSVLKFHERFGATKIEQDEVDIHYIIKNSAIKQSLEKYKKFLPKNIQIIQKNCAPSVQSP